jgi:hypothetical protein
MRAAAVVSLGLNPSLWGGGLVAALAARFEPPGPIRWVAAALGFVTVAVLPIFLLFALKAAGYLSDVEMRRQDERGLVYAWCAAGYAAGALGLQALGVTWPVWGVVALHAPYALALAALNRYVKVSIHAAGLAGVATAGVVFFGSCAWPLLSLPAAGAWARWSARAHTPGELMIGAAVGATLTGGGLTLLRCLLEA